MKTVFENELVVGKKIINLFYLLNLKKQTTDDQPIC